MSFSLDLPLSSGTTVAILALSGKAHWFKEQLLTRVNGFTRIFALSFSRFGGIVSTQITFLTSVCF